MKDGVILKNITKKHGKVEVLKNINLEIEAGEFVVLVGPSGCGKSTLLNIISGLETNFSGDIYFNQKNISKISPKDRDVAMVFQSYALYPNMTVRDNIAFGLKNRRNNENLGLNEVVDQVAESLQIKELLERKPAELSGGQRQRVAMGRAISRDPKLFLFDEPLSNLDANLRMEMRQKIKSLHHDLKTTIFYVTHDQIEAMTLADKIAVMKDGLIQQIASPQEIYHYPKNIFVASLIGIPSINLIPVELKKKDEDLFFEIISPNKRHHIRVENPSIELKKYVGKEVVLGVRAEALEKIKAKTPLYKKEIILEAEIDFIENAGADFYAYVRLNDNRVLARSFFPLTEKKGEKVRLNFLLSQAIFFDGTTGNRIA